MTGPTGESGPTGFTGPTGAVGTLILSGFGAPNDGLGRIGDFYIDLAAGIFYGPKSI
jgi:hypothetical protein